MTILSVVQAAAMKVGLTRPTIVFAATTREMLEMQSLIAEAANDIALAHDWQVLRTIATFTGDASATAFDLPSDYARMLKAAGIWTSRYRWTMDHVPDTDTWLELITVPYTHVAGAWTIYGGQFHILATMAIAETAKFFYISNKIATSAAAVNIAAFTADTDTFRLNEMLLKKALVWKWKAAKGDPYGEELADYEEELLHRIEEDQGSKPIIRGLSVYDRYRGRNWWPGTVTAAP